MYLLVSLSLSEKENVRFVGVSCRFSRLRSLVS